MTTAGEPLGTADRRGLRNSRLSGFCTWITAGSSGARPSRPTGSHLAHDYTMELFGRAAGTGLAGGALLSRTRPRPAGDVDRPRAGPAGGRQPRAVPGERARHRLPPRAVG